MPMMRKFLTELLGTALLVFFGVGVATLMFGFKFDGGSVAAGVVATALAFGLILLALAYTLGPISGCHVNPAVTMGFVVSGRMSPVEAIGLGGPVRRRDNRGPWSCGASSRVPPATLAPASVSVPTVSARRRSST